MNKNDRFPVSYGLRVTLNTRVALRHACSPRSQRISPVPLPDLLDFPDKRLVAAHRPVAR